MTNLDEKKLDELVEEFLSIAETKIDKCFECGFHSIVKIEDAVRHGYRQAFAGQQKNIEKLEKAVELMRENLKLNKRQWLRVEGKGTAQAFETVPTINIILADVDELLTEKPSEA